MCSGGGQAADWRDAAAYAPLLGADRSIFAWEWLRRDPGYRAAAESALEGTRQLGDKSARSESWGLHAFEPPHLAAPDARPVWSADIYAHVLEVEAGRPTEASDSIDVARIGGGTRLLTSDAGEHLLISDGLRGIRLDVLTGTLANGPVQLRYRLSGLASAERSLLTLRRFLALSRTGRFASSLHPRETRAKRWLLMLRTFDALATGADQREIAVEILSREAREARWRSRCPSVRLQVQRLVRGAWHMAGGGHFELLR